MIIQSLVSILGQHTREYTYGIAVGLANNQTRCVGVMKGGRVEIITNDQGNRITPSYVAWNDEERVNDNACITTFAIQTILTENLSY